MYTTNLNVLPYGGPVLQSLTCNSKVNISADEDCAVQINSDMFLEGGPYGCYDDYEVYLWPFNSEANSTGNVSGQVLDMTGWSGSHTYKVVDPITGNTCWGTFVIEDKLAPTIECSDITINCITPVPTAPIVIDYSKLTLAQGAVNTGTLQYTKTFPLTGIVTDVNLAINMSFGGFDESISLVSPSGTQLVVWPPSLSGCPTLNCIGDNQGAVRPSGACVDFNAGDNVNLNLSFAGFGFPGFADFSVFNGEPINGNWTAIVTGSGTINLLQLQFNNGNGFLSAAPLPEDACGTSTITHSDYTVDFDCETSGIDEVILRTWTIKDGSGNKSSCQQQIVVLPITIDDVLLPPSLVELGCGSGYSPADVAAHFDVDSRSGSGIGGFNDDWTEADGSPAGVVELNEGYAYGYPYYLAIGKDGKLHAQKIDNNVCNIYVTYTDQVIPACGPGCGGNAKIIRTWTILDWCSLQTATYTQIIKAVDKKAPTFIVKDVTVSVNPWGCVANFDVPMPWELADNCDATPTWWVEGPAGVEITGNPVDGYKAKGLAKGVHQFLYTAEDCCGNKGQQIALITVIDRSAPVAVAKQNIVISMTGSGTGSDGAAKLYAWQVDNGSYDHCSAVKLEIRRPDGAPHCENLGLVENPSTGERHNNNVTFDDDESATPQVRWAHPQDDKEDTDNGEYVKFCCEDLGGTQSAVHQAILRVWDDGNMNGIIGDNMIINGMQDNYNETWADIRVENKIPPVLVCPDDATITCDMELNLSTSWKSVEGVNLTMTGGPAVAYDLCAGIAVEYKDTPTWSNTCENTGRIRREFRAVKGNATVNCYQTITVAPIASTFVVTPPASSVLDAPCDFTKANIKDSEKPKVLSGTCDVIGENIEVQEFLFEDGVCKKWKVTYTYINWCTGEQKGPYTRYYKYKDEEKPVLTCQDQMFAANPNPQNPNGGCEGTVNLEASATDGGGCTDNGWLKWTVFVDLWGNGTTDYEFSSFLPTTDNNLGNDTNNNGIPDRYVAPTSSGQTVKVPAFVLAAEMSTHKVSWKVTDGCGNVTGCESTFMVVDKKAPTPYCVSLSSAVMENGQVELWAIDFNKGSFDNCTPQNALLYTFNGENPVLSKLGVAHYFKGAGVEATVAEYNAGNAQRWVPEYRSSASIFNCDDVAASPVTLHMSVWDGKLNTDFCAITLTLVDNQGACDPSTRVKLAGNLVTKAEEPISEVTVKIASSLPEYPLFKTVSGNYEFSVSQNNAYTVSASKVTDYTNGVSTFDLVLIQRHILGIAKLNSPEKLIAADVNNDGKVTATDLVELRKLILGMTDKLSNNDSWVFVPKSHVYADANNPYGAPRSITVNAGTTDATGKDFTGIKIGDVNLDATAAKGAGSDNRTSNSLKFGAEDKSVGAGEIVNIDVTASNFREIFGYQFTAKMTGLELLDVKSGSISIDENNYGTPSLNTMTMSWSSDKAVTATEGEVLFTMVMKATANGKLSNMMSLGSDVTRSESYAGSEMTTNNLEMSFTNGKTAVAGYALYQNEPNPFKANTVISYNMPEAAKATITLVDVTGKVVYTRTVDALKGMNKVEISRSEVPVSGVVYYSVKSGDFTATKAMIVIE